MLLVHFHYCPTPDLILYFADRRDFFSNFSFSSPAYASAELHMKRKVPHAEGLCQFQYSFLLRIC